MNDPELTQLRDRLQEIDRRIIELAGERLSMAREIGKVKQQHRLPTRDYAQERRVLERARETAAASSVPSDLADDLMLRLIRSSLAAQERHNVAEGARGQGKRALVIGGAGRMGRWFVQFLGSLGFDVTVADPSGSVPGVQSVSDWRELELTHDKIIVATPLRVTARILCELAEPDVPGIICDIGSLKTPIRSSLEHLRESGKRVTSIHPMFGPDTELLSGRHVIFVDVGVHEATAAVRNLFQDTMVASLDMDIEEHDRMIAYVLGISHAINLVFGDALARSGEASERLKQISSTTFDAQMEIARQVSSENPHLYYEIQALNEFGTEALSALADSVTRLREIVESKDEDDFVDGMERVRDYFAMLE